MLMLPMRLAGIDLNLLVALDAILETRSVTAAARELGRTQPAVSHALRKLRELLDDDLLVRTRDGMRPTPRALELRPAVRDALAAAERVLQAAPAFDPETARRTFAIAAPDMVALHFLPGLANQLAGNPHLQLALLPTPADRIADQLADNLDLAIGVFRDLPANIREEPLWSERFACVVRRGSPGARGRFDVARYLSLRHLFVAPRGRGGSSVDDELARRGVARTVAITVPHFLIAPQVIAQTDLVWTAPVRLAGAFTDQLPLTLREVPFPIPGFTVTLRWHVRLDRDPGIAWLRRMLHDIAP